MKLDAPFTRLPFRFDVARLQEEIAGFAEDAWVRHPNNLPGNSALRLITVNGGENDDVAGPMAPTPHLLQAPYLQQVLSSFGVVWSRSRLMKLGPASTVPEHTDINYHWFHRVRLHIPIMTTPDVSFHCGDEQVHMAAGESWIFDNWRVHKVENPSNQTRIHLVADTTGNGQFWQMVRAAQAGVESRMVDYRPGARAPIATERFNTYKVMPPGEIDQLLFDLADESISTKPGNNGRTELAAFRVLLDSFCKDWRQLWSLFADTDQGAPHYRKRLALFQQQAKAMGDTLLVGINGTPVTRVIDNRVAAYAVNDTGAALGGTSAPPTPSAASAQTTSIRRTPQFDRPVMIVSAPRSGSTALFETLSPTPQFFTVGGEAHWLVEGFKHLVPGSPGVDSNRLTGEHFDPRLGAAMQARLAEKLRDGAGRPFANEESIRLLEKTPKNSLRIPFFERLFPDMRYVFLWRDPRENISSIMEAWRAGGWVTYPNLPGWDGPWSLLLPSGWQAMKGKTTAEVAAFQWAETNRVIMDDLAVLPEDRRHVVTYADFIRDPGQTIRGICDFADITFDEALAELTASALPNSRYTLTAPAPEKWRANAGEIVPLMPAMEPVLDRLRRFS